MQDFLLADSILRQAKPISHVTETADKKSILDLMRELAESKFGEFYTEPITKLSELDNFDWNYYADNYEKFKTNLHDFLVGSENLLRRHVDAMDVLYADFEHLPEYHPAYKEKPPQKSFFEQLKEKFVTPAVKKADIDKLPPSKIRSNLFKGMGQVGPMNVKDVQTAIKEVTDKLKDMKVNVVQDFSDLPVEIQEWAEQEGREHSGAFHSPLYGTYLIANDILNPADAKHSLMHELGHEGLDRLLNMLATDSSMQEALDAIRT